MQETTPERLVVVQNLNSTNHKHVGRQVLLPLSAADVKFEVYDTQFEDTPDNIIHMMDHLPDDARVIVAAGDGTVEQVVNASIRGNKNLTIGAVPYGNFNDIAFSHIDRGQNVLDMIGRDVPTKEVIPLSIEVDGGHRIHAASYTSFGLTAIIAAGFRSQVVRDRLRPMPRSVQKAIRNGKSGVDYLLHAWSHKLPDFRVDGGALQVGKTDVAFSNNPIIAGIIHAEDTYYDRDYFGAISGIDMGNPRNLVAWGIPSLFGHAPLERAHQMHVIFEKEATIPMQIGGEYHEIESPAEVFVYKNPDIKVRILHPKASAPVPTTVF